MSELRKELMSRGFIVSQQEEAVAAIEHLKKTDPEYFRETLLSRLDKSNNRVGSFFPGIHTPEALEVAITHEGMRWKRAAHPAISEGCIAYTSENLYGKVGVVPLDAFEPDYRVSIVARKGMLEVQATLKPESDPDPEYDNPRCNSAPPPSPMDLVQDARRTSETWLICGKNQQGEYEMWTVHPGAPIVPSNTPVGKYPEGEVTVSEAIAMGFTHAKLIGENRAAS
jgi:hypothetical protein